MPASGARTGTTPTRPQPTGDGRVGTRYLTCHHESPANPTLRPAGGHPLYWCSDCKRYRRRA